MTRFFYAVEDHGESFSPDRFLDSPWGLEQGFDAACEAVAEHDYRHWEGWNSKWPLVYVLYAEDGTELARCAVELKAEPRFYAAPARPKKKVS